MLGAWQGSGNRRSPQLTSATYFALSSRNVQLNLSYVPSKENVADFPSRTMSRVDSKLSMSAFEMVDKEFGGVEGHLFDLMSLDSNVMKNKDGIPLPHFTPSSKPRLQRCECLQSRLAGISVHVQSLCLPAIFFDWSTDEVSLEF